jgi:UDP-N-acetylmuramate--alanine ligase
MNFYFIGIGGIGVSALARYFLLKGNNVIGSDIFQSEITDDLEKLGAKIIVGKHKENKFVESADAVIFSPAIPKNNPELMQAKKIGIPCESYPQALGRITKDHFTIAISGTHGKSTTTAMIGLLLEKAGFDPTVIVGTRLKEFGNSNCRVGNSKYLVIEADEHYASFLNYSPKIIVLTNIDLDHLDFYKNLNNIIKTYRQYFNLLPDNGFLVINKDDKNTIEAVSGIDNLKFELKEFSLYQKEAEKIKKVLKIPGEHNVLNALAALTVGRILGISDKIILKSLGNYKGSWRRFEIKEIYKPKRITLVSDYAHHPREIEATIKAAREKYKGRKIWCVFQPHQYQRTYYLFDEFVDLFKRINVDRFIITDIYDVAGREDDKIKRAVSSQKIINKVNKKFTFYVPNGKIIKYLEENLPDKSVLLIMGAGDIYKLENYLFNLKSKNLKNEKNINF